MALFPALPRRDTKPLAKTLLKTFGSFAEVIHAPVARLREIDGIGEASINQLKLIAAAAHRVAKGEVQRRTALSSWDDVIDYCRTSMAFCRQGAVSPAVPRQAQPADIGRGAADRYRRPHAGLSAQVIKRALELSASADPGAQPPFRRSYPVAGRHPDDQSDRRHRKPLAFPCTTTSSSARTGTRA
jgi:DNA repair protein RadC